MSDIIVKGKIARNCAGKLKIKKENRKTGKSIF
jgi:hypothetical protein